MLKSDFCFKNYIQSLTEDQLNILASKAGTTAQYIKSHLIYRRKFPGPVLIDGLVIASNGDFTKAQFIHWLYQLDVA